MKLSQSHVMDMLSVVGLCSYALKHCLVNYFDDELVIDSYLYVWVN